MAWCNGMGEKEDAMVDGSTVETVKGRRRRKKMIILLTSHQFGLGSITM
jgi:hypothetical protein